MLKITAPFVLTFVLFFSSCSPKMTKNEYPGLEKQQNLPFTEKHWEVFTHTFKNNLADFEKENVELTAGKCILKITDAKGTKKPYAAAEIRTKKKFKYGKFVVRMKAASGNGVISSFFLYKPSPDKYFEIDIEFTGKNTTDVHFNHWNNGSSNVRTFPLGFDASADFHEYAMIRLPGQIRWEVDGKEIYRTSDDIPSQRMNLVLNLWPSQPNDWAGEFDSKILPCRAEIDFVKIYSFN